MEDIQYRHENKYLMGEFELLQIENRLQPMMAIDKHAKNGGYTIRSLYFDDYSNSCFYDNEDGVNHRAKWRIRIYNHNSEVIFLENKCKENSMTYKYQQRIHAETYQQIMNHSLSPADCSDALLRKFCIEQQTRLLNPAIIVEYDRAPYVLTAGNVRVTFDRSIRCSLDFQGFFSSTMATVPILDLGSQMLEVKWDEFLPKHLENIIEVRNMQQSTFSKYYSCRLFMNR